MRRAFLSLPLLVAFALLKGCGGGDADSSAGAGSAAGAGAAAGGMPPGAGTGGRAGSAGNGASAGASAGAAGAAGTGGKACGTGAWGALPGVPKDWAPFSTPDCACTFYTPPPGAVVAPLEWEPCGADSLQGVSCQKLKASSIYGARWMAPAGLEVFRPFPPESETPSIELAFGTLDGTSMWSIIGPYRPECQPLPEAPHDGRYVIGTANDANHTHGVVAGQIGKPPDLARAALPNPGESISSWGASSSFLYRHVPGAISASPWLPEDGEIVYTPGADPDGLPGYLHHLQGDDAFLEVSAAGHTGFLSWTKATGLRQLLRTPHDNTRGFMHLGTDGIDLAFTYGESATKEYEFSRRTLFTAPYTTDPASLKATAKALTAIPRISAPFRWGVGCGYAVAGAADEADGVSLLIVRLSDGAWWRKWPKDPQSFGGIQALGVTCSEAVMIAGKLGLPTRVRLDALGDPSPPIPPDIKQAPF